MAKTQSPLLGYNTNVRHKGKVFHIQTEDSGVAKPHVITHLFADGGRIIKSVKTSYADRLEAPDLQAQVKKLMQDQHKAMFIALRDGHYDAQMDVPAAPPIDLSQTIPDGIPAPREQPSPAEPIADDSIELDETSFVEEAPTAPAVAAPPPPVPPTAPIVRSCGLRIDSASVKGREIAPAICSGRAPKSRVTASRASPSASKKAAKAIRKMRNGKSARRVEKAMKPAISKPSCRSSRSSAFQAGAKIFHSRNKKLRSRSGRMWLRVRKRIARQSTGRARLSEGGGRTIPRR